MRKILSYQDDESWKNKDFLIRKAGHSSKAKNPNVEVVYILSDKDGNKISDPV